MEFHRIQVGTDFTYNYQQNTNRVNDIVFYQTEPYNSYSYDGNGNVTKDEHRGISFIIYDADNLPLSIYKTNGEQLRYFYDVNGNRVRKSFVGGTENFYINDAKGNTEVLMHDPSGRNYSYNIRGNDVVGQIRITNNYQSGRIYFLKDHLGSIRMTLDASGNIIGYDDYYPFGSIMPERSMVSTLSGKYRFTGKERDTESGYDYFGARYYDSKFARWLSVDPLADKYPGWSPYNYTLNNPLRFVDPDGREIKPRTKSDKEKWSITEKKLLKTEGGRKLLDRVNKMSYDVPLSYAPLPEKINGLTNINFLFAKNKVESKVKEVILDDSKTGLTGFNDVQTPAHELTHVIEPYENPEQYWMNDTLPKEDNKNETSATANAAKIRKEYNKSQEEEANK